jgi:hypothetical protein
MLKYEENLASRVNGALQPMLGVKVTVTASNGLPATLYKDNEATVLANPVETDANGYFGFKAANGEYELTFSGAQIESTKRTIELYDADDAPPLTQAQAALPSAASRVGFLAGGVGAQGRTVENKLRERVSVQDFGVLSNGVADDTAALLKAINETPENGVLNLSSGRIVANFPAGIARSNITIRGAGMPRVRADGTQLDGGTAICGTFWIYGDNITLEGFGVDAGLAVCDTFYGGVARDALVVKHPVGGTTLNNINANQLIGLCKEKAVPYHAILMEGHNRSWYRRLHGTFGWWGVVIKATDSIAGDISAENNMMGGIVLKADSYAQCNNLVVSNIKARSDTNHGIAVRVWSDTAQLEQVSLSGILVQGYGTALQIETTGAQAVNNVQVTNVVSRQSGSGVMVLGNSQDVLIDGVDSNAPGSGIHYSSESTTKGIRLRNLKGRAAAFKADSVQLRGGFVADGVDAILNDMVTKSGISVSNVIPKKWNLGAYFGTLNINRVADGASYTLPNGWTNYSAPDPVRVVLKNSRVSMYGRIAVPPTPWTGKEVCFVLPSELWPTTTREFMCQAFDNTGLRSYPVFIQVSPTTGEVSVLLLTQGGAFSSTTGWVSLNGVVFDLEA